MRTTGFGFGETVAPGWAGAVVMGLLSEERRGRRRVGGAGWRTGKCPDAGRVGGTGVRALRDPYLMEATALAAFSESSVERAADLASFAAASCASFETT
ncbi:hypothetical protein GCM10017714_29720 [Curtobacterium pusillum]|nr:hypothetical protein GCM10017610_25160 [Curtobacterium pusillum]